MKATAPTTPIEVIHQRITEVLSRPITDRDEMADALVANLGLHAEHAGQSLLCNEDGDYPDIYAIRGNYVTIRPRD